MLDSCFTYSQGQSPKLMQYCMVPCRYPAEHCKGKADKYSAYQELKRAAAAGAEAAGAGGGPAATAEAGAAAEPGAAAAAPGDGGDLAGAEEASSAQDTQEGSIRIRI